MKLQSKILSLTVLLAAGIALTACGGSGTPASTPASSAVPASSHAAEERVTEPINLRTWTLDDLDKTDTVTVVSAGIVSGVQNGSLTANVFSYDLYKKEDVEGLAVGDKITFHEEGAEQNRLVTVEVKSIEKNDKYELISINGGMEEPDGLDLKLEDDDTYRTMTFDDYPLYYEMGEKTAPPTRRPKPWRPRALLPWQPPSTQSRRTGRCTTPRWWCRTARCRKCAASGCRKFCPNRLTNAKRML